MHLIFKYHFLLQSFLIITISLTAQKTHIEFNINGLSNKELIIAHHFGENTLIDDTININESGKGILKRDSLFDKGLYLAIYPNRSYFEFIIGDDQKFELITDTGQNAQDYIQNMKTKGSDINEAFFDYQLFMIDKNQESMAIRKKLKNDPDNEALKAQLQDLNNQVQEKWDEIQKRYPGTFLDKMLSALKEVDVPDAPVDENGNIIDSAFQYNYYKDNFFANFDFSDNQLLYSPVYHRKLKYFYERVVIRHPDSVITATDRLLEKFEDKPKYFQYTLAHVFNKYAKSKYMGFDKVIVHLAENYYLTDKVDWVSDEYLKKLRERVQKLKPNLIGAKAPKLSKAQTPEGYFHPLYEIDADYIVIAFFEPHCGHCKKVIPQLYEEVFMGMSEKNIEVFAFYTQADKKEWQEFIEEKGISEWINVWDPNNFTDFRNKYDVYSTPTIILLDKDKRIIAKKVDIETIKSIINTNKR